MREARPAFHSSRQRGRTRPVAPPGRIWWNRTDVPARPSSLAARPAGGAGRPGGTGEEPGEETER